MATPKRPQRTQRGRKPNPLTPTGKLVLKGPVTQQRRSYSNLRKKQVLVFLQYHLIPIEKNIYGQWPVQYSTLSGIDPPPEGYRTPTTAEAAKYFKINSEATIRTWWAARNIIAKGGIIKQYPPKWPELEAQLWDQFVAARKAHRIVTVHWFRYVYYCNSFCRTYCNSYRGPVATATEDLLQDLL
jgi:hypothetical protein